MLMKGRIIDILKMAAEEVA